MRRCKRCGHVRELERFPIYKRTRWGVLRRHLCDGCRGQDQTRYCRRYYDRHRRHEFVRLRDWHGRFIKSPLAT